MSSATGEFAVASCNEEALTELEGEAKLTRASVTGSLTGDLAGLKGEGTFNAPLGEKATIGLDYTIG